MTVSHLQFGTKLLCTSPLQIEKPRLRGDAMLKTKGLVSINVAGLVSKISVGLILNTAVFVSK